MYGPLLLVGTLVAGVLLLLVSPRAEASVADIQPESDTLPDSENFFPWDMEPLPVMANANLIAFLAVIRAVEGGTDAYDYDDLYGGGSFTNFYDHPYEMGTWAGVRLPNGKLTTAAGAYQITVTTWRDIGGKERFGSFDPAAQDAAALYLIERRGAKEAVQRGDFKRAISMLRNEWEAFAKMIDGQYPITVAQAERTFTNSGGELA
jgi:muramidase (phage lysozyme)